MEKFRRNKGFNFINSLFYFLDKFLIIDNLLMLIYKGKKDFKFKYH